MTSNETRLIPDQHLVYDKIINRINSKKREKKFIDAPGGLGKTFTLNFLLAKI